MAMAMVVGSTTQVVTSGRAMQGRLPRAAYTREATLTGRSEAAGSGTLVEGFGGTEPSSYIDVVLYIASH
jgi:hypothetical protein